MTVEKLEAATKLAEEITEVKTTMKLVSREAVGASFIVHDTPAPTQIIRDKQIVEKLKKLALVELTLKLDALQAQFNRL